MNDLISRAKAIEAVKNICNTPCNEYFVKAIETLPPVTPKPIMTEEVREALMAEGEMYDIDYTEWIPVSKGSPKDLEEVNVTYVNHNPPVYYEHERGKPHTAVAVLYQGMWYWWDSTITDTLAEYGDRACAEPIDRDISITAWKPLPKPYKESDSE